MQVLDTGGRLRAPVRKAIMGRTFGVFYALWSVRAFDALVLFRRELSASRLSREKPSMADRIENYALIGDCETAALVARDGSIDWLCWPRFDSGACFAALLGGPEHGRWLLAPTLPGARVSRRYLDDTLILETRYEANSGVVTVTDFMPVGGSIASDLVRIVRCVSGQVLMRTELMLRFDYGAVIPWVSRTQDGALQAIAGPERVVLTTSVPFMVSN